MERVNKMTKVIKQSTYEFEQGEGCTGLGGQDRRECKEPRHADIVFIPDPSLQTEAMGDDEVETPEEPTESSGESTVKAEEE